MSMINISFVLQKKHFLGKTAYQACHKNKDFFVAVQQKHAYKQFVFLLAFIQGRTAVKFFKTLGLIPCLSSD